MQYFALFLVLFVSSSRSEAVVGERLLSGDPTALASSCSLTSSGWGCNNGGMVYTSGCAVTCPEGKTAYCSAGWAELNSCTLGQDDQCRCW